MMINSRANPSTTFMAAVFLSTASGAAAQDVATSASALPANEQNIGMEDIVVTAQKRSESLQKAAASIQVVQSETLIRQGVTDLRSLEVLNTGIKLTKQQTHAQIFIRGIGATNSGPNTDPAVAVLLNGGVVASELTGASLYDIERTEVLAGPQGTLYGTNAAGGVINVTLRKPGKDFAADGIVEGGNYDYLRGQVGLDIPLGDQVQIRAVGNYINRDGFASNGLNDERSRAGRLTLVANPTDNIAILLWGGYTYMGGVGDAGYQFIPRPGGPFTLTFPTCCGQLVADPAIAARRRKAEFWQLGGQFDWTFGNATLTWIPNYQKIDILGRTLIDTGAPLSTLVPVQQSIDVDKKLMSHELRLAAKSDRIDWLFGLYYYYQNWGETRSTGPGRNYDVKAVSRSYAAFGQLKFALSDTLRIVGGARYAIDKKRCDITECAQFIANVRMPFDANLKWEHVDWKAGLEADLSPISLLYGTVQTGYLPGGFQILGGLRSPQNEVAPQKLRSFSLGSKNRFLDGRLTLNAEAFYYDYRNYQTSVIVFAGTAAGQSQIFNARKARIYGIEANSQFRVTPNDQISAGFTLNSSKFTNFKVPQNNIILGRFVADFSGFQMPLSPKFSATVGYQHTWDLNNGGRVIADILTAYNSGHWVTFSHGVQQCLTLNIYPPTPACLAGAPRQKEFTNTNLSLTYYAPGDRWSAGLWVKNLENEAIATSGGEQRPNTAIVAYQPPRTYGARLTFNF